MQTYFIRDIVSFTVEVEHNVKFADYTALYLRRESDESVPRHPLELPATEFEEISRVDTNITSRVTFERELLKSHCLPGEYSLYSILGHPPDGGRAITIDLNELDVTFCVVEGPAEPNARVTGHRLGFGNAGRQYLS